MAQTYIFFDLETTGIPVSQAKITELSFVSVSRRDLEREFEKNTLPPMSRLSLYINPLKTMQPGAVRVTGITNEFLKNQPPFKDTIDTLNAFLDKPKPVCLVAHNGNRFDFKIIKAEYLEAKRNLPQDLLCVDSLTVFKNIMKPNDLKCTSALSQDENDKSVDNDSWAELSKEEIDEIDELVTKFSNLTSTPNATKAKPNETRKEIKKKSSNKTNESLNETPKKSSNNTNESLKETSKNSPNKTIKESPKNNEKISYKLGCIYERLLNKKITNAHQAEADCIALLECVLATKKEFLSCADSKQKLLHDIKV